MTPNKRKPVETDLSSHKKTQYKSAYKNKHNNDNFNPKLYISRDISEDDVWLIKEAFDFHDSNKVGLLNPNDLKQALFQHKFYASKQTVYNLIAEYDDQGLGGLTFDSFIRILSSDPTQQETTNDLKKVFKKYDKDGKGYITQTDLQQVSRSLGEKMSKQQIQRLFNDIDIRKTGKIEFEDFCKIMHNPNSLL